MKIKIDVKAIAAKIREAIRNFDIQDCRVSLTKVIDNMADAAVPVVVISISAFLLMLFTCLAAFFITVKGPEKVLVPQVEGKELTQALIEMQAKELYPKIQMRYDESPAYTVLNQSPDAGAIVKAGRRVTLTVSRGAVLKEVENYVGLMLEDVKIDLSTKQTGQNKLITLAEPTWKPDLADEGTILAQDIEPGTKLSEPVVIKFVVSRGPNFDKTRVVSIKGKTIEEVLNLLPNSKLIYDFTGVKAHDSKDPDAGKVFAQTDLEEAYVDNYSRVAVEVKFPYKAEDDLVYGIFAVRIAEYPYPVAMTVECVEKNGQRRQITSLNHTGGNFSVPYALPSGSEIVLKVAGREVKRTSVGK